MLEAGSGFCFATESLQMCLRGPMSQPDYFESYCAVETFLPGAINYALSTTTDLLEQFVVTKVGKRLCRTRNLFNMRRSIRITRFNIFNGGAVIRLRRGFGERVASGYRRVREQTKACLKQASGAKSFRCVGEDF